MATINKKLIHFNKKDDFESRLANGDILETSIVFIKDTNEIWTHGEYYAQLPEGLLTQEEADELYATKEELNNKVEITEDGFKVTEIRIVDSDDEPTALVTKEEASKLVNKASVESVLTGNITSHTHNYLPITGNAASATKLQTAKTLW